MACFFCIIMFVYKWLFLLPINHSRKPNIQPRPNGHIQEEYYVHIHLIMSQQQTEYDEWNGDALDKNQWHAWGEAHRHELVVDVGLVWQERVLVTAETAQNHAYNIQTRYQQDAEGNDDRGTFGVETVVAYVHAVLDNQKTDDVAQGKAASVAHEYLTAAVGIAK